MVIVQVGMKYMQIPLKILPTQHITHPLVCTVKQSYILSVLVAVLHCHSRDFKPTEL
jgi:hypothetical protein